MATKRKALELLLKFRGTDRFLKKCEATGYTCTNNGNETVISDSGDPIGIFSNNIFELNAELSETATNRELDETQWNAFVVLDRWRVAVHEAGHTILAVRFGLELDHVSLCEHDNAGETCLLGLAAELEPQHPRRNVDLMQKFFAAGAAAELVTFGTYNVHGVADDLHEFSNLSKLQKQRSFEDVVIGLTNRIQPDEISAVARLLDQKGYLSVHRVKKLLASPKEWKVPYAGSR